MEYTLPLQVMAFCITKENRKCFKRPTQTNKTSPAINYLIKKACGHFDELSINELETWNKFISPSICNCHNVDKHLVKLKTEEGSQRMGRRRHFGYWEQRRFGKQERRHERVTPAGWTASRHLSDSWFHKRQARSYHSIQPAASSKWQAAHKAGLHRSSVKSIKLEDRCVDLSILLKWPIQMWSSTTL